MRQSHDTDNGEDAERDGNEQGDCQLRACRRRRGEWMRVVMFIVFGLQFCWSLENSAESCADCRVARAPRERLPSGEAAGDFLGTGVAQVRFEFGERVSIESARSTPAEKAASRSRRRQVP
jgi:hypothetical protein